MLSLKKKTTTFTPNSFGGSVLEVGAILKQERQKRGLSVRDVREITHIPTHSIVAIESGDVERLPDEPFLTAFIRRYSRVLGFDEYSLCESFIKRKNHIATTQEKQTQKDDFDLFFDSNSDKKAIDITYMKNIIYGVVSFLSRLSPNKTNVMIFVLGFTAFIFVSFALVQFTLNSPELSKYKSYAEENDGIDTVEEVKNNFTNEDMNNEVANVEFDSKSSVNSKPVIATANKVNISQPKTKMKQVQLVSSKQPISEIKIGPRIMIE